MAMFCFLGTFCCLKNTNPSVLVSHISSTSQRLKCFRGVATDTVSFFIRLPLMKNEQWACCMLTSLCWFALHRTACLPGQNGFQPQCLKQADAATVDSFLRPKCTKKHFYSFWFFFSLQVPNIIYIFLWLNWTVTEEATLETWRIKEFLIFLVVEYKGCPNPILILDIGSISAQNCISDHIRLHLRSPV